MGREGEGGPGSVQVRILQCAPQPGKQAGQGGAGACFQEIPEGGQPRRRRQGPGRIELHGNTVLQNYRVQSTSYMSLKNRWAGGGPRASFPTEYQGCRRREGLGVAAAHLTISFLGTVRSPDTEYEYGYRVRSTEYCGALAGQPMHVPKYLLYSVDSAYRLETQCMCNFSRRRCDRRCQLEACIRIPYEYSVFVQLTENASAAQDRATGASRSTSANMHWILQLPLWGGGVRQDEGLLAPRGTYVHTYTGT